MTGRREDCRTNVWLALVCMQVTGCDTWPLVCRSPCAHLFWTLRGSDRTQFEIGTQGVSLHPPKQANPLNQVWVFLKSRLLGICPHIPDCPQNTPSLVSCDPAQGWQRLPHTWIPFAEGVPALGEKSVTGRPSPDRKVDKWSGNWVPGHRRVKAESEDTKARAST
jgi:hypothetical protein